MANTELLNRQRALVFLISYATISLFVQAIGRLGSLTPVWFLRFFCRAADVQFSLVIPHGCWF